MFTVNKNVLINKHDPCSRPKNNSICHWENTLFDKEVCFSTSILRLMGEYWEV